MVELFNVFLSGKSNSFNRSNLIKKEDKKENGFLLLDFDLICKNYLVSKYTLEIKKKEAYFLKNLNELKILQKKYIQENLDNEELLNLYWLTFLTLEKSFKLNDQEYIKQKTNLTVLPNQREFECIMLNSALSIKRRKEFYVSFLRVVYFSLYCLGLDLRDIFHLKKNELLQIEYLTIIKLNLNERFVRRTVSVEIKKTFALLKEDLEVIFDSNQIYTKPNKQNISEKSLLTLVNRDLEIITESLNLRNFKSESFKIRAVFNLREKYSEAYVLEEFQIPKSFLKRIEVFYQTKA